MRAIRRPSRPVLVLLATGALLAGCAPKNSLVGTWDANDPTLSQQGAKVQMTFGGSDVKMTVTVDNAMVGKLVAEGTGTYQLEGETLTVDMKDVKVDDSKVAPAAKAIVASALKPETLKAQMNRNPKSSVKFTDKDNVTLTPLATGSTPPNGQTVTLKRATP